MLIEQITRYLQGKLTEEEAMNLWVHLIQNPEDLALLKTYKMYRELFKSRDGRKEQKNKDQVWNERKTAEQVHTDGRLSE